MSTLREAIKANGHENTFITIIILRVKENKPLIKTTYHSMYGRELNPMRADAPVLFECKHEYIGGDFLPAYGIQL